MNEFMNTEVPFWVSILVQIGSNAVGVFLGLWSLKKFPSKDL